MKTIKNKTTKIISVLLILAYAFSLMASTNVTAQLNVPYVSTGKSETYAFIGATPNPVGVGQQVLLHIGITQQLNLVQYGWEGLTITVTKPNGEKETLGPYKTDSTGGTGAIFVPNIAGNYTLQSHFPQQRMPTTVAGGGFSGYGVPANTTMLAAKICQNVSQMFSRRSIDFIYCCSRWNISNVHRCYDTGTRVVRSCKVVCK